MKKRHKLLSDKQWELIEPLFPKPKVATRQARSATSGKPGLFRGYPVGFADRSGLAFLTGRVSLAVDLLAAITTVAGARRLAGGLARIVGRARRGRTVEMGRNLSGR
jgi:hypothetical protein